MRVATLCTLALTSVALAQSSCSSATGNIKPTVASGYSLQLVATGLSKPRGILLDNAGHLLVVESGSGVVSAHTLSENGGCVTLSNSTNITNDLSLNHGIALSSDGRTLYASSTNETYSWQYDSSSLTTTNQATLVDGMSGSDHTTRTLLLSQKVPGMMVISRGSTSNLDYGAANINNGVSQVKAFQLNDLGDNIYNYTNNGTLLGWGLRNEVGIAEHPDTGAIWGVENSADQLERDGVDVSNNNPGEELNFLGYLNRTNSDEAPNYGYPWCFAAWGVDELPDNGNLTVGNQFAINTDSALDNQNRTDAYCAQQMAPRLTFQAHMAPLDIKFNDSGREAFISFHGSWDRKVPVGYKVAVVQFENGEPVDPSTSMTAATDIIGNQDLSECPDNCFRPVAMAIDSSGRIFVSSDATGEIYLITRTSASTNTSTSNSSQTSDATSSVYYSYIALLGVLGATMYTFL